MFFDADKSERVLQDCVECLNVRYFCLQREIQHPIHELQLTTSSADIHYYIVVTCGHLGACIENLNCMLRAALGTQLLDQCGFIVHWIVTREFRPNWIWDMCRAASMKSCSAREFGRKRHHQGNLIGTQHLSVDFFWCLHRLFPSGLQRTTKVSQPHD